LVRSGNCKLDLSGNDASARRPPLCSHPHRDGFLINADTKKPFTYKDACVVHGPHLGYDPVAAQAARASVNAFLKSVFKLD
jgi:hypothetical protein